MTTPTTDFSGLLYYNPAVHGFNPVPQATIDCPTSMNEYDSITVNVVTWDLPNGNLFWRVVPYGTNLTLDRFTLGSSDTASLYNNRASFTIAVSADSTTSPDQQSFDIIVSKTLNGPALATVTGIIVNDTSQTTTYSIVPDSTSVNEGDTITFTVTTTGVADGTTLYHWAGGNMDAGRLTGSQDTVTINSGTATFTVTVTANNFTDGGGQTFYILLGLSNLGDTVAQTDYISVADTSLTPSLTFNNVTVATQSPFAGSASYSFSGSGTSTVVAPGSDNWAVGTGDFTIEWFQYETDANPFPRIFHRGAAYPSQEIGVSIEGGTFYGWFKTATSFGTAGSYKNAWVHFAIVRSGTSLKVFKNGTQLSTTKTNSTNFADTSSVLTIGRETNGIAGTQYGGYITNFRWVKGLAVYTGNFTVPTSALTSIADANPYGGSNTVAIPDGATKLLLAPAVHTATQAVGFGGANGVYIDTNASNDAWASTVPVGATIIADGVGTFTVANAYTPGTFGDNKWFFTVNPNTSSFPQGVALTFIWTA